MFAKEEGSSQYYRKQVDVVDATEADAIEAEVIEVDSAEASVVETVSGSINEEVIDEVIYVHLCGAVIEEGVYEGVFGERVYDFLVKAGGFSPEAATDYINLAREVVDGERIYFPTEEEIADLVEDEVQAPSMVLFQEVASESNQQDQGRGLPININTASQKELMNLPGIGESKALAIIEYRKTNRFECIEDIKKVVGIKEATFASIKDKICVN